jgi:hypothetical protein
MPVSYNTSAPTPESKNTINSINKTYNVRDFLLHRNIQNPTKYPQLLTSINGAPRGGEPFLDTSTGNNTIIEQKSVTDTSLDNVESSVRFNTFKDQSATANQLISIDNTSSTHVSDKPYIETIDKSGLLSKTQDQGFRKQITSNNLYLDTESQIDSSSIIQGNQLYSNRHIDGYLNNNGNLNIDNDSLEQATDVIGSLINGQGVGFNTNSGQIISNFDLRSSIAGRVLTSVGLMKDTPIGVIGAKALANAMTNNSIFNAEQKGLGALDLQDNILSIIKDGKLSGIRPNYSITVNDSSDTLGKIANIGEDILGFQLPVSKLSSGGSIFFTENGGIGNVQRANNMLTNTGKGQVAALGLQMSANLNGTSKNDSPDTSVFRSGYCPAYQLNNKSIISGSASIYAYDDGKGFVSFSLSGGTIPTLYDNSFGDLGDDYSSRSISEPTFSWVSKPGVVDINGRQKQVNATTLGRPLTDAPKKSLLAKTQALFNDKAMKTVLSVKGDTNVKPSQINTAVVNGAVSRGSNVRTKDALTNTSGNQNPEDIFCRSWTTYDRYDSVNNLIRHSGLNGINSMDVNHWRPHNTSSSVLDDNGFVKIGPYKSDNDNKDLDNKNKRGTNIKKYMLSIENLAWAGTPANNLPLCEQGPGDPTNPSIFGRIMWFPPYDISFTENATANWETTNFIGRGEPVYTHNNSERTGTLTFKIIVDHPSQVNGFQGGNGPTDDEIDSYFAGCTTISSRWLDKMTNDEKNKIEQNNFIQPIKKVDKAEIPPDGFSVYFLNDITHIEGYEGYEDGDGIPFGQYQTEPQTHNGVTYSSRTLTDVTDYGLNAKPITLDGVEYDGFLDSTYITAMKTYLKEKCPHCQVTIKGYASKQGWTDANNKLATDRANNFYSWFKSNMLDANDAYAEQRKKTQVIGLGDTKATSDYPLTGSGTFSVIGAKKDRRVDVSFQYVPDMKTDAEAKENNAAKSKSNRKVNQDLKRKFYNEANFFEKLVGDDPFVFDEIRSKIKYFHPAFHSTTPEGLNSRLTFLNQCTRQGPTFKTGGVDNLSFGRPPVCILRIGDFYNIKVIIDNINFDYEPLVWDLNPEGVGVQPMIANVNMSFKFIGGSTLEGPINKLQNALSFNYYANSQVYDIRADYVENSVLSNDINMKTDKDVAVISPDASATQSEKSEINSSNTNTTANNVNTNTTSVSSNDLDSVVFYNFSTDSDAISVTLNVTTNAGLTNTNGYDFKVFLLDSMNNTPTQIGVGNLNPSELFQAFTFLGFNDKLVSGQAYTLQVKFDGRQLSKTFTQA